MNYVVSVQCISKHFVRHSLAVRMICRLIHERICRLIHGVQTFSLHGQSVKVQQKRSKRRLEECSSAISKLTAITAHGLLGFRHRKNKMCCAERYTVSKYKKEIFTMSYHRCNKILHDLGPILLFLYNVSLICTVSRNNKEIRNYLQDNVPSQMAYHSTYTRFLLFTIYMMQVPSHRLQTYFSNNEQNFTKA